jgi:hypothetical protein
MLIQVTLLGEGLATAKDRTYERFFLGVASQVVEKIVPFLETSLTPMELTQEHLSPSLALRFEIFDIFERP